MCPNGKDFSSNKFKAVRTPDTPIMCMKCVPEETFFSTDGTRSCEQCFGCSKNHQIITDNCSASPKATLNVPTPPHHHAPSPMPTASSSVLVVASVVGGTVALILTFFVIVWCLKFERRPTAKRTYELGIRNWINGKWIT